MHFSIVLQAATDSSVRDSSRITVTLFNRNTSSHGLIVETRNIEEEDKAFLTLTDAVIPSCYSYATVHGFATLFENGWAHELKDRILATHRANVFIIGWSGIMSDAKRFTYKDMEVFNRVAIEISNFFNKHAIATKMDFEVMHFIAHSIGARITNYAIAQMRGSVGQLTALDPYVRTKKMIEGNFFPGELGVFEVTIDLKFNSASLTVVVHTDSENLGYKPTSGDVDVYLNGGVNQPGCDGVEPDTQMAPKTNCNHQFATKFFKSIAVHQLSVYDPFTQQDLFQADVDKCFRWLTTASTKTVFAMGYVRAALNFTNARTSACQDSDQQSIRKWQRSCIPITHWRQTQRAVVCTPIEYWLEYR